MASQVCVATVLLWAAPGLTVYVATVRVCRTLVYACPSLANTFARGPLTATPLWFALDWTLYICVA